MILYSSADFLQNKLKKLLGTLVRGQTVWIQVWSWFEYKLFTIVISRRQKLLLARKQFRKLSHYVDSEVSGQSVHPCSLIHTLGMNVDNAPGKIVGLMAKIRV